MIVSLMFEKVTHIEANKHGKFMLDGEKMSIKDVPFVRYRFSQYGDAEIEFIQKSQDIFNLSGHLVEITVEPGYVEIAEKIREVLPKTAIYYYLPICEYDVQNNELSLEKFGMIEQSTNYFLADRLMLKDTSNSLHLVSANKIRESISSQINIPVSSIGICSSPLSFGDECCLTAERARMLATKYSDSFDCVLPTANHEGMNCCGCLRYIVVTGSLICPETKAPKVKSVGVKGKKKSQGADGLAEIFHIDGQLEFDQSGEISESPKEVPAKKEKPKKLPKNVMKLWN